VPFGYETHKKAIDESSAGDVGAELLIFHSSLPLLMIRCPLRGPSRLSMMLSQRWGGVIAIEGARVKYGIKFTFHGRRWDASRYDVTLAYAGF